MLKKLRYLTLIAVTATLLSGCSLSVKESSTQKDFDPFTETKQEYDARVQWFRDAKLGVFVHWNPSSLIGQEISWSCLKRQAFVTRILSLSIMMVSVCLIRRRKITM
jgi:hypothetical protein